MTAPLGPSSSLNNGAPGAAGALAADDSLRPQLRSRQLSFQFGPLGIRYSTDQISWSPAGVAAAASAAGHAVSGGAEQAQAQAAQEQTDQVQAAQSASQAASQVAGQSASREQVLQESLDARARRSFGRELRNARRREAEAARSAAQGQSADAGEQASAQDATQRVTAAGATGEESFGGGQGATLPAPSHLVRRAISAYLACAQGYSGARPMLSATA